MADTSSKLKARPSGKKASPLTPDEQQRRFEEAARELGCDASEHRFNEALDVIGRYKPKDAGAEAPKKA